MPANLTPEFKAAEAACRKARDPRERLEWLREMLRTIPKHKGTDHLQADIKTRIKELTEELAGPKKGGSRGGPATVIRPEGAAQIALLGPPNSGKSSLHARLTGSNAQTGPYPFTTRVPQPGMLPYQDIYLQLIDLPPLTQDRPIPWIRNALQPADACLLVVDLGDPACVEHVMTIHDLLAEKGVTLAERWDEEPVGRGGHRGRVGQAVRRSPADPHDRQQSGSDPGAGGGTRGIPGTDRLAVSGAGGIRSHRGGSGSDWSLAV